MASAFNEMLGPGRTLCSDLCKFLRGIGRLDADDSNKLAIVVGRRSRNVV